MFNKRKNSKGNKSRNVNFELPPMSTSEGDESVPGFYFGSASSMSHLYKNPLPWESSSGSDVKSYSHEEIEKIIAPADRFESLLSSNYEKSPEIFVPTDMHHFDEEDYSNHRRLAYPHMHQPLKSMEPRVLRKLKEKIKENKSLEVKAATAGVPTSVPELLASSIESRVLIDNRSGSRVVSGPVLSLVSSQAPIEEKEDLDIKTFEETVSGSKGNKKRRKRKKRIRKQEPFQPTLGKLSEESSSPILSGTEEMLGIYAEDDDDFEEDEDGFNEPGGLILEDLCSAVNTENFNDTIGMIDSDSELQYNFPISSQESDIQHQPSSLTPVTKKMSFLEEISSTDHPVGFLDLTHKAHFLRKYSLPVLMDGEAVDASFIPLPLSSVLPVSLGVEPTSGSNVMMNASRNPHILPMSSVPILLEVEEHETTECKIEHDELPATSETAAAAATVTEGAYEFCESGAMAVSRKSSLGQLLQTGESRIWVGAQPGGCNFQIGSSDNILETEDVNQNYDQFCSTHDNEDTVTSEAKKIHKKSPKHHHHHHHHHHHKEHYNKRDLEKRTFSGQDMRSLWMSNGFEELSEHKSMLGDAILDDMKSHRYYDMPALNRTRIKNRYMYGRNKKIQRSRSVTHTQCPLSNLEKSKDHVEKCMVCKTSDCKLMSETKNREDLIFQSNVSHIEPGYGDHMNETLCPLFVEMDILKPHKYWREVSRWVRYEQVYNEFSDTFGRAHSSPLKFTAFTQFRIQMEDALFIPNVESSSFSEAIALLTEELLVAQLFSEPRDAFNVREVFKWKHVHAGEKIGENVSDSEDILSATRSDVGPNWVHGDHEHVGGQGTHFEDVGVISDIRTINTTPENLNNSVKLSASSCSSTKEQGIRNEDNVYQQRQQQQQQQQQQHSFGTPKSSFTGNQMGAGGTTGVSSVPLMLKMLKSTIPMKLSVKHHHKSDLEGHLPNNTEGVTVQVGEMQSLKKPFLVILRFKTPLVDRVTEISVPIRFMVVCLGPPGKLQYEEVGRVISTMMINKVFRKTMYQATDKYEIIDALYKYLDTCFVLSYSESHPARNMHTMIDHIHDFMRLHSNPVSATTFRSPKDRDCGIKHSASVNWADEQKPLLVRQIDMHKPWKHDVEEGGGGLTAGATTVSSGQNLDNVYTSKNIKDSGDLPPRQSPGQRILSSDTSEYRFTKKRVEGSKFGICFCLYFFIFRLLRLDIMMYRRRFISDLVDAFRRDNILIVICGLLYLYFVCLSPALTFGALLGKLVSDKFTVQSVLACNGCLLILFALISGNPMVIVGITGPMFLMETVIGKLATNLSIDIMIFRFLISIYVSGIGLVSLACNITWIMQKVRRSVEECFNAFIGLYFIFKAVLTILNIFFTPPPPSLLFFNGTFLNKSDFRNISSWQNLTSKMKIYVNTSLYQYENRMAIGFASLVMAYMMYQICVVLNSVKRGRFFTRKFRKMVDYFNVAIGILVLSIVNILIVRMIGINLPTLKADVTDSHWIRVPDMSQLTTDNFPILANVIAFFLAIALLSLSFTETAIAGITVTKAERKLVKPSLFALDQFVCLCILPVVCGTLGWPFICGAAVRSTSYVISMTKWDQKVVPGVRHKIIGVVEQRVTLVIVGILILGTVAIESVLRFIPVSAMLGMFLYMGVMAIRDLVVTRRLIAMFKRCKHWKDHDYLKDIPPNVLRWFEGLQILLIVLIFTMNCISEFSGVTWTTFLIPVILLIYAISREKIMPNIAVFAPHLDKLDPRHLIHVPAVCPTASRQCSYNYFELPLGHSDSTNIPPNVGIGGNMVLRQRPTPSSISSMERSVSAASAGGGGGGGVAGTGIAAAGMHTVSAATGEQYHHQHRRFSHDSNTSDEDDYDYYDDYDDDEDNSSISTNSDNNNS